MFAIDYARPGLDAFLTAVYPFYDIVIWSQTSWRWLEDKLVDLKMVGQDHDRYKVSFVLDKTCMFHVHSLRNGVAVQHQVKALPIIWSKFPQWSALNTIHIDDLSRNGVCNPGQLLKISPFRDARKSGKTDRELKYLSRYLVQIAELKDFSGLDHSQWKTRPGVLDE